MIGNRVPFVDDVNGKGRTVMAGSDKRSRKRKIVFVRLCGSGVKFSYFYSTLWFHLKGKHCEKVFLEFITCFCRYIGP